MNTCLSQELKSLVLEEDHQLDQLQNHQVVMAAQADGGRSPRNGLATSLNPATTATIDSQLPTLSTEVEDSLIPTEVSTNGGRSSSEEPTPSEESESETEETAADKDLLTLTFSLVEPSADNSHQELTTANGTKLLAMLEETSLS